MRTADLPCSTVMSPTLPMFTPRNFTAFPFATCPASRIST